MKRFLASEIGAAVLWVIGSLVLAAAMAPWLYHTGKLLAGEAMARDLPALVEWFAAACGRAKFGRFFDRALLLSALLLLPLLLRRIRMVRASSGTLERGARARGSLPCRMSEWMLGFAAAAGTLGCLCLLLHAAGANELRAPSPGVGRFIAKAVLPAVGASVVEEWVFRGVLLGLWLRFARPAAACAGSSLLFSFLHFLKPPAAAVIASPDHPLAGYRLLGSVFFHYADPRFLLADFSTLVAVGLVLCWARLKSGALWLPMGLHAGWIVVFKACGLYYQAVPGHVLRPWGVGDSLRSGILPLLTLGATAVLCWWLLDRLRCGPRSIIMESASTRKSPG